MKKLVTVLVVLFLVSLSAGAADPKPLNPADIPHKVPTGVRDAKAHWARVSDKYNGQTVSFGGKIVNAFEDTGRGCYFFAVSTTYTVDRGKELLPLTETSAIVNVYVTENSRPLYEEFRAALKARKVVNLNLEGVLTVEPINAKNAEPKLVLDKCEVKKKEVVPEPK